MNNSLIEKLVSISLRSTAAVGFALLGLNSALAAGEIEVLSRAVQITEVKNEDGSISSIMKDAVKVLPGSNVTYLISVKNVGDETVNDVQITNPIHESMEYQNDNAPAEIASSAVSVDTITFADINKLEVIDTEGRSRPATKADVNAVRWTLNKPIKPGDQHVVVYTAQLK